MLKTYAPFDQNVGSRFSFDLSYDCFSFQSSPTMPRVLVSNCLALILFGFLSNSLFSADTWTLEKMTTKDSSGNRLIHSKPVAEKFRNRWPEELEKEFQQRAQYILSEQGKMKVAAGNTYFENEKRTYGYLMAQALGERGEAAIKDLQLEDAQAKEWHSVTEGIDFYAAFTLKHQVRKYFYFGDELEPAYKKRMFEGAKKWTAEDPMRRHHPAFKGNGPGWGPDAKDSWVDVRSTENLFLMRVTSVYLMAEETGNEATRLKYKELILDYTKTLYRIGMGEWDSENYHGHSLAPLCNLYDFSSDEDVKLAAKACLDWMCAIGALKYYHGSFCGPSKRDYNHAQPFGGSAPNMLWVYFGDSHTSNTRFESDEVHILTSAYRPPLAVVELARKKFPTPVTLFNSKPPYDATTSLRADAQPEYLETFHIAKNYLVGSLASGTSAGTGDVNGFKALLADSKLGAVAIQGTPGPDPEFVGSPKYAVGKIAGENRIVQVQNALVWLVKGEEAPWRFTFPKSLKVTESNGVTIVGNEKAWIALRPLGTPKLQVDLEGMKILDSAEKSEFKGHTILTNGKSSLPTGLSSGYCGYAIELGDIETFGSLARFEEHLAKGEIDSSKLQEGIVQYKTADGKWLGFHWNDNPSDLGCWINGKRHDWKEHARHHYRSSSPEVSNPIQSEWGSGRLQVTTQNAKFECLVDERGKVMFSQN